MTTWSQTATGGQAWHVDPWRTEVSARDIAESLCRQCRYGGHLRSDVEFYSVAQHSVLVSRIVPEHLALVGLLHDATEAYLQDIVGPWKATLAPIYAPYELEWARRIGDHFGLRDRLAALDPRVKHADRVALATERRDLLEDGPEWSAGAKPVKQRIVPLLPFAARDLFVSRLIELGGAM